MAQKPVMEFKVLGKRTREAIIPEPNRFFEENKHNLHSMQGPYGLEPEYMDNMEDSEFDESTMKKQKRRSKNDFQGRDHKCTCCDKTYLSYPALYTHMKNKHAKGPDG